MEDFKSFYILYLRYFLAKDSDTATIYDKYMALSYAVRTHVSDQWINTQHRYRQEKSRRVYYISLDYNLGRSLKRYIVDAGIESLVEDMASTIGATMDEIFACEAEFELGNSPRGGMSHCIQEALASQGLPAMGYGLWYDFASFTQKIVDGKQCEEPYNWSVQQHPWNVNRPEYATRVAFGGVVTPPEKGASLGRWVPSQEVVATPWDYPVVGYKNGVVNTIRFWQAVAVGGFHPDYANHGDYARACEAKLTATDMTHFLFPNDDVRQTTESKIKQYYFLAAASLRDIVRRYRTSGRPLSSIGGRLVIHISDSRSTIAVIEMLHILMVEEGFSISESVKIIEKLFIFSSAALEFDDMEDWPLYLVEQILPLHAQIIKLLNQHFLDFFRLTMNLADADASVLSLIKEGTVKKLRLGNIGVLISRYVSGVSDYQTRLLKDRVFKAFERYRGTQFVSGVYGISLRRWLTIPNPELTKVLSDVIGDNWVANNRELVRLVNHSTKSELHDQVADVKIAAKSKISSILKDLFGISVDPKSLFVMHNRRIHPASRQMLEIIYIVHRFLRIKGGEKLVPRTYIFGGRAAPSDFLGKQIIHLISMVSEIVNGDKDVGERLRIFFVPNITASVEESFLPAIDVVEQPSAKNSIAYGMSILKYIVNGAIPLVGENPPDQEVADVLGRNYVFTFSETSTPDTYCPDLLVENSTDLKRVFEYIETRIPEFKGGEGVYPLLSSLRYNDEYKTLGAFESYSKTQDEIDAVFPSRSMWMERVVHNIGRSGEASLDDVVSEFYNKAWS